MMSDKGKPDKNIMDCSKWKNDIDHAVANVCIQIIKEPLSYFSEADIQQLLVEELRKIKPISKAYSTSVQKGKDAKSKYTTSLLHREYGGEGGRRIDIVIFDPVDVAKIDNANLKVGNDYLRPVYAFELGTEKSNNAAEHVKNDIEKLSQRTKNGIGYLIHFYKDITQSATGTKFRDKTEEKIEKEFKQVFDKKEIEKIFKAEDIVNVRILAILLRTFRNQKKMWGKCEIFDGNKWIKTNIGSDEKLKGAILEQLEKSILNAIRTC